MRRNPGSSFRNLGPYTSPGTPEYGDINSVGDITPKTWSSERVPLPTGSSSRRYINAAALIPFNSGRALPSKWDDAERWITSPISGQAAFKNAMTQAQTHDRQPKSKSGPLGPTGLVYLPNSSPSGPAHEGGNNVRNFLANSPLTTGVLVPGGLSVSVDYGTGMNANSNSLYADNNKTSLYADNNKTNMTRSTSVPGLSDMVSESSQDDKLDDCTHEEESHILRRDMATQMSPSQGTRSSSHGRLSFCSISSPFHENPRPKDDVRDVQVDKGTTSTPRQSRRLGLRRTGSTKTSQDLPSSLSIGEASRSTSKLQREKAKITAWENLQKAKAEAAIRKLEMKLEKKRSASMDKIVNKVRSAQMKAQAMRELLTQDRSPTNSQKGFSFCIYIRIYNCFVCNKS